MIQGMETVPKIHPPPPQKKKKHLELYFGHCDSSNVT